MGSKRQQKVVSLAVESEDRPKVSVVLDGQPSGGGPWHTSFRVINQGDEPINLLSAWMPHVVYHGETIDLSDRGVLAPNAEIEIEFEASYAPRDAPYEQPNPFLFVRMVWRGEEWRLLVQLALAGEPDEPPSLGIARINAHRVGFSGGLA